MTIDEILNDAATWVVWGIAAVAHALVFIYGLGSPWWRSLLGITIFAKWLSVMLVFDFLIARRALGEFPGYGFAALGVYGFMFLAFSAVVVEVVIERRHPADEVTHRKVVRMSNTPITTATVPEIWYKAQRVLRTIVAVGIPSIITAATVLPLIIEALGLPADLPLRLWLVAFAAGLTAVAAAITRVMAIPQVNAWLTKIGLGSVPRDAVVAPQVVSIDPKVADNGAASTSQYTGGSSSSDGFRP